MLFSPKKRHLNKLQSPRIDSSASQLQRRNKGHYANSSPALAVASPPAISSGDAVTYAFEDNLERQITIYVSDREQDASKHVIWHKHQLIKAMNIQNAKEGKRIRIRAGGKLRAVVIVKISKAASASPNGATISKK